MADSRLNRAKGAKNDEFYTRRVDIEDELCHYADHFRGKVVYCNCDDPTWSEFWRFFVRNFKAWGLKKLMATHYEPDEKNYSYSLEICEDTNGDGRIDIHDEPTIKQLPCNGDFRSAACIELLQEADIVVTNPPFSLFREYIAQLMEYGKKFLVIGNKNAVTYKEIFPLIKENKIWIGCRSMNSDFWLRVPDDQPCEKVVDGVRLKHIMACWYTNLDVTKRHEPMDLRGNYFSPEKNLPYENYEGINVDDVVDIPGDYDGIIGVPITYLNYYCPEQFEILSCHEPAISLERLRQTENFKEYKSRQIVVNGVLCQKKYHRIFIRRKKGDSQ